MKMTLGSGVVAVALLLAFGFGVVVAPRSASIVVARTDAPASQDMRLLVETGRVFESVAKMVSPAVVFVEARERDSKGTIGSEESGSGVLVRPTSSDKPVVVTNWHVVSGSKPGDIAVHLADGRLIVPKEVRADQETDLAVLILERDDLPAVRVGSSDDLRIGQWVLAIGSPFGLSQSVTHGIISAKHRRQVGLPRSLRIKEFLQTDAAINPGNSGGPLVNLQGELVGINTAIASHTGSSSGVGFSIPSNLVSWVVNKLSTDGKVERAFLGVEFPVRFDYDKAKSLGMPFPRGALVAEVHVKTPAESAGIRRDDVILEFDGRLVEDDNHLINIVSQTPILKDVAMVVWRGGEEVKLKAQVESWAKFNADAARSKSGSR